MYSKALHFVVVNVIKVYIMKARLFFISILFLHIFFIVRVPYLFFSSKENNVQELSVQITETKP